MYIVCRDPGKQAISALLLKQLNNFMANENQLLHENSHVADPRCAAPDGFAGDRDVHRK